MTVTISIEQAVETKTCTKCKCKLPAMHQYFGKDKRHPDGLHSWCHDCKTAGTNEYRHRNRERYLQLQRERYWANPEHHRAYAREWYHLHREECIKRNDRWKKENPEKCLAAKRAWEGNNKENVLAMRKTFRTKHRLSLAFAQGIRHSLKKGKNGYHWEELVPYSFEELKEHLESQFKGCMSWNNYGTAWQIDHVRPISSFRFETSEDHEFQLCWSLDNLRPLWKHANQRKNASWDGQTHLLLRA